METNKNEELYLNLNLIDINHDEAKIKIENFVLKNENNLPISISTDNSPKIIFIIKQILNYYGFIFKVDDKKGTVKVIN